VRVVKRGRSTLQGADANRLELVRVLVAKDRDMVGIEHFARALECFGPLETPAQFLDEIEVRPLSLLPLPLACFVSQLLLGM
jgi:hypothetical protein